jgi:hypothetical protein
LTNEEFNNGWNRMVTMLEITKKLDDNLAVVKREFWKKYRQSSASFWEKCVERAINDPGRRFFPSLGEMAAFTDDIRDDMRKAGCSLCDWTGWVEVQGKAGTGVKACVCRGAPPESCERRGGLKSMKEIAG